MTEEIEDQLDTLQNQLDSISNQLITTEIEVNEIKEEATSTRKSVKGFELLIIVGVFIGFVIWFQSLGIFDWIVGGFWMITFLVSKLFS